MWLCSQCFQLNKTNDEKCATCGSKKDLKNDVKRRSIATDLLWNENRNEHTDSGGTKDRSNQGQKRIPIIQRQDTWQNYSNCQPGNNPKRQIQEQTNDRAYNRRIDPAVSEQQLKATEGQQTRTKTKDRNTPLKNRPGNTARGQMRAQTNDRAYYGRGPVVPERQQEINEGPTKINTKTEERKPPLKDRQGKQIHKQFESNAMEPNRKPIESSRIKTDRTSPFMPSEDRYNILKSDIPKLQSKINDTMQKDTTNDGFHKSVSDIIKKKQGALLVVAIDFGTTYSGYAYSFRNEYTSDHNKIYTNMAWVSGDSLATYKTPTSILFNKSGSFHSFGYDAEQTYAESMENNADEDFIFFSRFKMKLFQNEGTSKRISNKFMLYDDRRRTKIKALTVFSESIKYFKTHFKESCTVQSFSLKDDEIHWVLTVPAIWTDNAKQFMRLAAEEAGIPTDLLTLAYEPEAAALYCKEMTVQKKEGSEGCSMETFDVGQSFLVLDCGGGTVDITAYEVLENFHLRELARPTGGPWGGIVVDGEYMNFLKTLIGEDDWNKYEKDNPEDVLEMKRRFEAKKKSMNESSSNFVTIQFSSSLNPARFSKLISMSDYASSVFVKKDKLRFDKEFIKGVFSKPISLIIDHLRHLLRERNMKNIRAILMVGGFSESKILYEAVKDEFKHLSVICPPDAVTAVLKGAVMFGNDPDMICERVCPRTYGVSVNVPFDSSKHLPHFKEIVEGKEKCTNIFKKIVEKEQRLIVGKSVFPVFCRPSKSTDSEAVVDVYESTEKDPLYTLDDNVRPLGSLTVPIPDVERGKDRVIKIEMMFGYTEIFVTATEEGTNNEYKASFKCVMN